MKNRILLLLVAVTFLMMQTCLAAAPWKEIPKEDIAIGGVNLGATRDYVESVYGKPDSVEHKDLNCGEIIHLEINRYGTSFFVTYDLDTTRVVEVKSTGNNGLKVPAGFAVGDNISDVRKYYNGAGFSRKKNEQHYTADWYLNLHFEADSKGKIKEIIASENLV
nr:MAG TPA: CAP-associated protein [Caudoviricetes sp.]